MKLKEEILESEWTRDEPQLLERAVAASQSGVVITDSEGPVEPIIYVNRGFERITGYTSEEVVGRDLRFLQGTDTDQAGLDELRVALEEDREWSGVLRSYRKDGTLFWQEYKVAPVHDEGGYVTNHVAILSDVTERKAIEDELVHRAFHDPLTDLPNRVLFMDRLGQALARTGRRGKRVAVLLSDLDNFKNVNDSLGHEAGDKLLVAVAGRFRSCLRPEDTVARLGGDEFAILLEDVANEGNATRVAKRIARALRSPISLDGYEVSIMASIGIAFGTLKEDRPEDLLRNADAAMYRAKKRGKNRFRVLSSQANHTPGQVVTHRGVESLGETSHRPSAIPNLGVQLP